MVALYSAPELHAHEPHVNMATTQQVEGVPVDRRTKALEEYRKKLFEHRELDAKLKKRTYS